MLSVLSFKGIIQAPKTEMERDRFSLQSTSFHYLKLPQWFFGWREISHTWSQAQDICNTSIKLLATYWSECLGTMSSSNIKKKKAEYFLYRHWSNQGDNFKNSYLAQNYILQCWKCSVLHKTQRCTVSVYVGNYRLQEYHSKPSTF